MTKSKVVQAAQRKRGWGFGRFFAILIMLAGIASGLFGLSAGQATAAGSSGSGNIIDAAKLKSMSRLYFPMRDDKKQLYTLYLFASDEKKAVTTQDKAWAGASAGDVIYTGKYQAALVKSGQKTGRVQSVNLNFRSFNATRNESFRLPGDGKSRPDLLFLAEAASSNGNDIYGFVITGGTLHSLDFASETGEKWGKYGYAAPGNSMRGLSGSRIQIRVYDNSVGQYSFGTYKLNLKGLKLQHVDSAYSPSQAWPTRQGSHAFLDSLKKSALRRELPANPGVKIGMTESQVRKIMGIPVEVGNGEWSGYLGYRNSWIGFDEYVKEGKLPMGSRVWELTQDVKSFYLNHEQVKEWLGVPDQEYWDEEQGGYILLYHWNQAKLSFWYEDEFGPITSFTIY